MISSATKIDARIRKKYKLNKSNINDLSGRRLLNAYDKLEDHFLLMYGDNYWPINLEKMIQSFNKNKSLISLTGYLNKKGKGEYGYKNNTYLWDNIKI